MWLGWPMAKWETGSLLVLKIAESDLNYPFGCLELIVEMRNYLLTHYQENSSLRSPFQI